MRKNRHWQLATEFQAQDKTLQTVKGVVSWWRWLEAEKERMGRGPGGFRTEIVEASEVPHLLSGRETKIPGDYIALAYVKST